MIVGIILGAGEGKRIGKPKLKLPLGSKKVIEWVLEAAESSSLDKTILAIRPEDEEISKIAKKWGVKIVLNPDFYKGISTTIQKALLEIDSQEVKGFFLILGDQPLISSTIINELIKYFSPGKREIVVPYYKGRRGNPVLFDIYWKKELMTISGDVGGRVLIKSYPEKVKRVNILDEAILFDIDNEDDYLRAKTYLKLLQNRKENKN
ncbi:MAG: nucleotidyltransferase family protein [Candidatus Caldatribacteriota bacterium]|nr:nucleotidyltransferase family protein [Candidatus Caldatribacteriota bacterium]